MAKPLCVICHRKPARIVCEWCRARPKRATRCDCDDCYADFEAVLPPDGSDDWDAIKCPKCGSAEFGWSEYNGDE